jgi:cell division protein FtsZ
MLVGETQDKNKTEEVVRDAMNHPLLDVDYRGASGGLVHITGGPDLTLKEAESIASNITERLEASANVIWGARIQDNYKGKVRVMAIMTGVQSAQVLGPSTQKQADRSREQMGDVDAQSFDASQNVEGVGGFENSGNSRDVAGRSDSSEWGAKSDGGQDKVEQNNGLDVIR